MNKCVSFWRLFALPTASILAWLCATISRAQTAGVGAGNSTGESEIVQALSGVLTLPMAPVLTSAVRLDKDHVKVTLGPWDGGGPQDVLHVFRAKDDEDWEDISPSGPAGGSTVSLDFIDSAPADHDYRYVAVVVGPRTGEQIPVEQTIASDPSNELRVADIAVKMEIGAQIATLPIDGFITFDGFLPESFASEEGATAPDPYESDGPYEDVLPYTSAAIGKRIPGFLQRGKSAFFTATITDGGNNGAATFWSSLTISEWWVFSDEYVPPLPWFATAAEVAVPDLVFDGNTSLGFDGRSNPKWQMLPAGGGAEVTVHAAPLAALTPEETWSPQIVLGDKPGIVTCAPMPITATQTTISHAGGSGDQLLTQHAIRPNPPNTSLNYPSKYFPFWSWGGGGDFGGLVENIRGTLGVDIRPAKYPTVRIYAVSVPIPPDPLHPNGRLLPRKMPDAGALKTELDLVYGQNANVWFSVSTDPTPVAFGGAGDLDSDGRLDMSSVGEGAHESDSFATIAANDDYTYSIFVFPADYIGFKAFDTFLPFYGGKARTTPGEVVFDTDLIISVKTLAHELGHCMNLRHAFDELNPISAAHIPDFSETRVMGYGKSGRRVIKPERDLIHARLQFLNL